MKRKITALCVVVAMLAVAIISGTMAYFTDTDEAVNVMVMGNVKIEQIEEEWNADKTALQEFTQSKELLPYVGELGWDIPTGMEQYRRFTMNNELDKYVSVKNVGKSDAFVRTIIALEMGDFTDINEFYYKVIGLSYNDMGGTYNSAWTWSDKFIAQINGQNYLIMTATYTEKVASGVTTEPSLLQVYMNKAVTQEIAAKLDGNKNGKYEILAFSQAVQAAGFTSAQTALNEAFGEINASNLPWSDMSDKVDTATNTVELKDGETVRLMDYTEPLTVNGNGTLVLVNADIAAASGNALTVEGTDVKLVLEGACSFVSDNGSGIGGTAGAVIDISGNGVVTAIGNEKHQYGIGGTDVKVIISDVTIEDVRGGFADATLENIDKYVNGFDYKYTKNAPEGASAIGGSVIVLDNVIIENAVGGSKAAAIGAMYWNAVDITINNSVIKNAQGGISAAAIGGSRIKQGNASDQTTTINIVDSNINAVGGYFGAGIGSGYDTHCHKPAEGAPLCTINIKGNSVITAQGGKYAAGIGTGYHAGMLAGEIESTVTVTAASGEKYYKDTYTQAQDIGFGVIDPARDGLDNNSSIIYNGSAITIPTP